MKPSYDVAIIGLGTMGSFACSELARRGRRVIGFDRFVPPHSRGSHSGDTRVFRIAYAEHPDYVPLAVRSSELWDQYEATANIRLLTRSGMLSMGPREGDLIGGILKSSAIHGLEAIQYTSDEIRRAFPAFTPEEEHVGVFEPKAGWIDSNAAIKAAQRMAKQHGAQLQVDDPVNQWSHLGSHFEVSTASNTIAAERLVVTAGAWTAPLLRQLGLPLRVERKVLTWIDPIDPALFQPPAFPVFAFSEGFVYGFPAIGDYGVKLGIHWKREHVLQDANELVPEATLEDASDPLTVAAKFLPGLAGPLPGAFQRVKKMKTCLYVMSHDEHFYLDEHPGYPGLFFAAGFSGHGFKFAPAIGESLADLATIGVTSLPIRFLNIDRLTAPGALFSG